MSNIQTDSVETAHPLGFVSTFDSIILQGDCRQWLTDMPVESVDCVVTSPPYYQLRNYDHPDQIGLEVSVEAYVEALVEIFRRVRRILKPSGTAWLNLGDTFASAGGRQVDGTKQRRGSQQGAWRGQSRQPPVGFKSKDLLGIPWRVALALQADGWWLRADIIWHKPNAQPSNVRDRPARDHEYLFLLSRSAKYFYDYEAAREPVVKAGRTSGNKNRKVADGQEMRLNTHMGRAFSYKDEDGLRNRRTVWSIPKSSFNAGHFATFPQALVEPCILAGCPEGGVVLDPFAGSGTVGVTARSLNRRSVLIELNPEYVKMIENRLEDRFTTVTRSGSTS